MINAVERLIEQGTLNKADVMAYMKKARANTLHACATRMHTLFCRDMPHEQRPENLIFRINKLCYWYVEETLSSCWEEPTHSDWLKRCETQMAYLDIDSAEEFLTFLNEFSRAAASIESMVSSHPSTKGMFRQLLE